MNQIALTLAVLSLGCAGPRFVPPPRPPAELVLVWVGKGECERYEAGRWVRAPEFDYEFSVEQRRSGDEWNSVKSLRRLDPAYDGSAGPRLQTWFFHVALGAPSDAQLPLTVDSSLGSGSGTADRSFRQSTLSLAADVPAGAPFDRYRITQTYDYEGGALNELVELNRGESPWVRNRETALLFAAQRFPAPPTTR